MSNRFEFDGVIAATEEKQSKAGKSYWVVDVSGDSVTVPFTVFTPPPKQGIAVRVTGKLGSYNGWPKMEQTKIEVAGGSGLRDAMPAPVKTGDNAQDELFDGELPF